jgi:hypothetical protein
LLLILFPAIICDVYKVGISQRTVKIYGLIVSFLLILIATLRSGTGTDYYAYESIWREIKPMDFKYIGDTSHETLEPGFRFLVSFLRIFTDNDRVFFFIMSTLSILPLYFGLKRIKVNFLFVGLLLFYLIFYIPYTFNGMRQAIAMSFFILTLDDILNKRTSRVLIIGIIAMSFHFSGVIILISYIICKININPFYLFFSGLLVCAMLIKFLSINTVFQYFNLNLYYLEDLNFATSIFQFATRFLIVFLLFLFYQLFVKEKVSINGDIHAIGKLLNIYLIGFFLYIYFKDLNVFSTRINMFFRVLEVAVFPMLLSEIKFKSNRILLFTSILILGLYIFMVTINVPENAYNYYFDN